MYQLSADTITILITCAIQLGSLLRFMLKWEARMTKMETLMGVFAAKNGNGVEAP